MEGQATSEGLASERVAGPARQLAAAAVADEGGSGREAVVIAGAMGRAVVAGSGLGDATRQWHATVMIDELTEVSVATETSTGFKREISLQTEARDQAGRRGADDATTRGCQRQHGGLVDSTIVPCGIVRPQEAGTSGDSKSASSRCDGTPTVPLMNRDLVYCGGW